ncbi:MAG: TonB-dependent receptor, partial [Bacteroidota bacterium]
FVNYERQTSTTPASNFIADNGSNSGDNVTRVLESDLTAISNFLRTEYGYETGAYQGWDLESVSNKFLVKLNYNISDNHKASIRYNHLEATSDQAPSIGGGAGNEFNNINAMAFENSGWERNTGVRSVVGELSSMLGSKFSNRFIASYTFLPESREVKGQLFPYVNIGNAGSTYISFGSDPFANNNVVDQQILNIQNEFDMYLGAHILTVGVNYQNMKFKNGFTRIWQGNFQYSSLADFYNSTDSLTNTPIGVSTGQARPFIYQRRYSGLEDGSIAFAEPEFSQVSLYLQDDFQVSDNLQLTGGIRIDIPSYVNAPS